jgi:VanZ family protein
MATLVLRPRDSFFALLDIVLLGGLLELLQAVFGRDADIWDFVANGLGAVCGFGVAMLVWRMAGALD